MKAILISLCSLLPFQLISQLSMSVDVDNATCSSNGAISVSASGGSGNYSYQLQNDCGDFFPPQPSNVFETLPPCDYTVSVTDENDGQIISEEVVILPEYQPMVLSLEYVNCDIVINVEGGNMPYQYSFSTNGLNGNFVPNQPENSNVFSDMEQGVIWFQVEDNCGNTINISGNINSTQIQDFSDYQNELGITITPSGGNPPYIFSLSSDAGVFENESGVFPWDEIGCNPLITITDQCSGAELTNGIVDVWVDADLECVNFAEGSAIVVPEPGIEPFTFTVETPQGNFTFDDGNIEGLPPNLAYYIFHVEDACGQTEEFRQSTRIKPSFDPAYGGCEDDEISFNVERQCNGPIYPLTVSCLNCSDEEQVDVDFFTQTITFSGFLPGQWDILITDDMCGDSTHCQDELILELTPACDSISALVVDQFSCDNGIEARRVVYDTTTVYSIWDATGVLIEEGNTSGVFENLPLGEYEVTAFLECDTLTSTITLEEGVAIDPYFETRVSYYDNGTGCDYQYALKIEKQEGPFILSGGPDDYFYQELNNYGEDNCQFYNVSGLLPGVYTLASLSRCGEITIELPDIPFNEITGVTIESSCPNNVEISIEQPLRSAYQWLSLFAPYDLNFINFTQRDRFKIGNTFYVSNSINGLEPGNHTVYLYPLGTGTCPVDSFDFVIPEYEQVELHVSGDILCDNNTTTDMVLSISGGNAPYQLREVDCNNSFLQISTNELDSLQELLVSDLGPGSHCYVVRDACGISSDFQETIRYYDDEIEWSYQCDSTVVFGVDSLNLPITWRDGEGDIFGTGHQAITAIPEMDAVFSVEVELPACSVIREVDVLHRAVTPVLTFAPPNTDTLIICGDESIQIYATTDAEYIAWSTGEIDELIHVTETGQYNVQVTNDLGCLNMDTIEVLKVALPAPMIEAEEGFCMDSFTILNLNQTFTEVLWSNNSLEDSLIVADEGTFWVEVQNDYGCTHRDSVFIEQWELPVFVIEGDTVICPGTTTVLQPDQTYVQYEWSVGDNSSTINVGAGEYELTVTDEHFCSNSAHIIIEELPEVSASITGDTIVCKGTEASISFSLIGMEGEATLFLDSNSILLPLPILLNQQDVFLFEVNNSTNLQLASVELEGYPCPIDYSGEAEVTVNPEGNTFDITPISCYGMADGMIAASAQSLFPPYQYSWNTGNTGGELSGVNEGMYWLTITDDLGCTWGDSIYIEQPEDIKSSLEIVELLCYNDQNGAISLNGITGGTLPYFIVINDSLNYSGGYELSGLSAGVYHQEITDANGCQSDTLIILTNPQELIISLGEDEQINLGDSYALTGIVNSNNINEWSWLNVTSGVTVGTMEFSVDVQPFQTTTYQVRVQDNNGCVAEDVIMIEVSQDIPIYIPNAFSPNNDGVNDLFTFYLSGNSVSNVKQFQIFDRWGEQVFSQGEMEMNGSYNLGWNGRSRGEKVQTGVYTYFIKLELVNGENKIFSGDLLLMR